MKKLMLLTAGLLFIFNHSVFANEEDDLAAMQQQLNAETMNKPFLAEQPEKVDAYIKEAMKKNIKPIEYEGTHWRRGYTCRNLLRWSWHEYRNCRYYRSYYGRYYY
jgi:hypothetical protein